MLRFLYRSVLRAHPPYFRQRFADEMQSIFDHAASPSEAAGLLVEAGISLVRQWTLRPQFWERPTLAEAATGSPLFYTLGNPMPRAAALVYGALLSVLVLNGVCWTMGYAWNHPRFMDIRPGYGPSGRVPESKMHSRPTRLSKPPTETSLYTDQGRVLLVFNSPAHPSPQPQSAAKPTAEVEMPTVPLAEIAPSPTNNVGDTPPVVLQTYAGTYVGTAPGGPRVIVTIDSGRLQLDVVGQFRSPLAPLPNPQLLACGVGDCWVMFSTGPKGTVDRIEVHHLGREMVAFRAQSGMVF